MPRLSVVLKFFFFTMEKKIWMVCITCTTGSPSTCTLWKQGGRGWGGTGLFVVLMKIMFVMGWYVMMVKIQTPMQPQQVKQNSNINSNQSNMECWIDHCALHVSILTNLNRMDRWHPRQIPSFLCDHWSKLDGTFVKIKINSYTLIILNFIYIDPHFFKLFALNRP